MRYRFPCLHKYFLNYHMSDVLHSPATELTSCNGVFLKKEPLNQLVKFPAIYENRIFITGLTEVWHWPLHWAPWTQYTNLDPNSFRFNVLSSNPPTPTHPQNYLFPSCWLKLCMHCSVPMHSTRPNLKASEFLKGSLSKSILNPKRFKHPNDKYKNRLIRSVPYPQN